MPDEDRQRRTHPIDIYAGARMRERRIQVGKSQQECADYVGLSFQQIQKYEKGTNRIAPARLYMLAQFLEVDVNYFFEGYDDHNPPSREDGQIGGADLRRDLKIAQAVKNIPSPDVQKKIVALAAAITKMAVEDDGG